MYATCTNNTVELINASHTHIYEEKSNEKKESDNDSFISSVVLCLLVGVCCRDRRFRAVEVY